MNTQIEINMMVCPKCTPKDKYRTNHRISKGIMRTDYICNSCNRKNYYSDKEVSE